MRFLSTSITGCSANVDISHKHSSFSSAFPIYLFTQRTEEVPDEEAAESETPSESAAEEAPSPSSDAAEESEDDDDEAIVEDVPAESTTEDVLPKTKTVVVDQWVRLNSQPPLWMRYAECIGLLI